MWIDYKDELVDSSFLDEFILLIYVLILYSAFQHS